MECARVAWRCDVNCPALRARGDVAACVDRRARWRRSGQFQQRRGSRTMNISDLLAQSGGLQSMARELGISESQASAGAAALIPAILGGFRKEASAQPNGLEGLAGILGNLGGASLADDVLAPEPTHVDRGNAVLGQIFGSKDVSRAVAA